MNRRTFLKTTALTASCIGTAELFARESASPHSIRPDTDGMLLINRRREFILGLYMLPNAPDPWREARDAGFNLVHVNADLAEFAKAHNLYAWTSLGSIPSQNPAEAEARIRKTVTTLKDEPALLFWETEDEPTFVWKKKEGRVPPADITRTYQFAKNLDPNHPFYLNHSPTNQVATLQTYNSGADIVATDIYPVIPPGIREMYALWPDGQQGDLLNPYISQVGQYADKMRLVAGPKRAVFMVLQAFAWENLRDAKERDPKMILYPTRQQLRFMAWQSVVHGVNGLLYWGLSFTPADAPLWNDLKAVAQEMAELKEPLAARRATFKLDLIYRDNGHSLDRGIEWIAKPDKNGILLIAVNADKNPVEVTFSGLKKFSRCEMLIESRPPDFHRGNLSSSFAPFEAHLYRLSS